MALKKIRTREAKQEDGVLLWECDETDGIEPYPNFKNAWIRIDEKRMANLADIVDAINKIYEECS